MLLSLSGSYNINFATISVGSVRPFLYSEGNLDNLLIAASITAEADLTGNDLIRINTTEDITVQNVTSQNGRVVLNSEQQSIAALDITSGSEEGDNIFLQAGDGIDAGHLSANELGVVKLVSGTFQQQDSTVVGNIATASITGTRLKVESAGSFTTSANILTK